MNTIDLILIFILAFATASGFFFGLIRVLGALVTIVASIMLAGIFYGSLSVYLRPYLLNSENLSRIAAFLIIYWFTSLFLSFVVKIVNKIFNLPLLKTVNRLLGGIIALASAVLVLSIFFYLFKTYSWVEPINDFLAKSVLIQILLEIGGYVKWVVPGI
jgi:membrane protein required for colicin V production